MDLQEVLTIIGRALIVYFSVLLIMRIMGKREIGKLSPVDLVVAIMIAELAAIPMEDPAIPLHHGLIPIGVLVIAEVGFSYLAMKSPVARDWLNGSPTVIIENGRLLEGEMRRTRYNLNDLMAQMREKNVPNINDVEFAILETSGKLSIIPKSQKRPLTAEDLHVPTAYEGLPTPLILDGKVDHRNLRTIDLDEEWLIKQLQMHGAYTVDQVFFASIDSKGEFYLCPKMSLRKEKPQPAWQGP
ncbi:DUF421 domain-containing protein [Heliobacterium gestii]|uniref:DUF421 domain-containing protein n=1 Tax=Heliomicrobium gestii TaxID=2699 RepID=A0A845LD04_HELGE|nr:DUF421 domain-containing protein [Heliomicrobium gestii]MBM7866154.1 uncharacterized membrane protein YcaP (DUF421 family) [Heliomicrobium gestii]MZP42519.1 DUF421 domain-containing protein [Heliomicrobium gestii]